MTEFWNSNIQVKTLLSLADDGCIANSFRANKRSQLRLKFLFRFLFTLAGWCLISTPLSAQINSDGTLGTEVNTVDNVTEITGGTEANSNLFHSFQDFSLSTGETATFNNGLDIDNIIGRVTGNNISNINGLIQANGSANLILINPRGLNFGEGASLDIGGSFLGSTAESVIFEDGTILNTDAAESLITVSAPIGLQLGQNSAAIEVSGAGYQANITNPQFSPVVFGEQSGISVKPGNTLALLGNGITIDGGIVAAPGGKIELISVAVGIIDLNLSNSLMSLSYGNLTNLNDLELRSQSLVDASGTGSIPGGSIQVRSRQLSLNDGSLLLIQNQLADGAGAITVDTSESITLSGTNNNGTVFSSIKNETLRNVMGSGFNSEQIQVGSITISTGELTVEQGANISSNTSNNTTGGNIIVDASKSILVQGFSQINPRNLSFISTSSFGTGDAGNTNLSTAKLTILDGARIGAGAFGSGLGGEINVRATDSIEVTGVEPSQSAASLIGASSLGVGNAGNVSLDTARLVLRNGGRVDSSSAAVGSAGDVNIQASESIEISGQTFTTNEPSRISSGANIEDEIARQIFQLPDTPSGNAGSVIVSTGKLQIEDRGEISVINSGLGDGGKLEINAEEIFLDRQGVITAATKSGEGGNIVLNADQAILQDRSLTTATAAGNGNGGNITINADSVVTLGSSQITADAFLGMGGDVAIDVAGLIICELCQVSASSRLGIDGVVNIETLEPTAIDLLEVPQQPTQPKEEVAVACPSNKDASVSQLTITGRGGLPNRPQKTLNAESIVEFAPAQTQATTIKNELPLPARSWYKNEHREVVLTAQATNKLPDGLASASQKCRVP